MKKIQLVCKGEILSLEMDEEAAKILVDVFYHTLNARLQEFFFARLSWERDSLEFSYLAQRLKDHDGAFTETKLCQILGSSSSKKSSSLGFGRSETGVASDIQYHGTYQ